MSSFVVIIMLLLLRYFLYSFWFLVSLVVKDCYVGYCFFSVVGFYYSFLFIIIIYLDFWKWFIIFYVLMVMFYGVISIKIIVGKVFFVKGR